ncbi:MBL fold metallo-hydrolase [Pedobacter sp. SYP-B3415]|uniref:MBL fold metallo-hydrolase n=1 Tax=Pedobacter sp. SYP-B3415 TaxID=2496641 RepID=UPI0013E9D5CF|nr:MBL fold metallo-hydrolase [Pedobacter sp. SYP-B3415]
MQEGKVHLRVIGCGDAFGSGGRLNTSFLLQAENRRLLIDCGASTLAGLKKYDLAAADLDAVVITHFHGDHYGGIPFLLMDLAYSAGARPLQIITPAGGEEKIRSLLNLLYPGADPLSKITVNFLEYSAGQLLDFEFFTLQAWRVLHTAESEPHGLRIGIAGKTVSYSGDTSWTDVLFELSDQADLFMCECNFYNTEVEGHMTFTTLQDKLDYFTCKKVILTHLGPDMLARSVPGICLATDGMLYEIV